MAMINYYDILEINENASQEVIKVAYKALAKKYHPDGYKGNEVEYEKKMTDINEAYEVLSDDSRRRVYDSQRRKQTQEFTECDYGKSDNKDNKNWDEKSNSQDKSDGYYEKKGFFRRIISDFGKEIVTTIQKNNREMDNAFLEGMSMDESSLIIRFKKSTGYKRAGYAKALESKGVLEKNSEGQLVPTYRFRHYF